MMKTTGLMMVMAVALGLTTARGQSSNSVPDFVQVKSRASLIHLGSIDSFDRTEGGIAAAKHLLAALESHEPKEAAAARVIYQKIIPDENFGGEYTALEWFCDYLLAPEEKRAGFLTDRFVDATFHFFADDDFATLKEYLKRKYKLAKLEDADRPEGQRREGFLEDFILFNNPRREHWEKTSRIYEVLDVKPGQAVADIGCGPGYYSFEFAKKVGNAGRVYAIDINDLHVQYVSNLTARLQVNNIVPVVSTVRSIAITNQVDLAYMCSLYHIIYTTLSEPEKDDFIASIRRVLKPDGVFAVVDNAFVDDKTLPYHGPYIARELLVAQLQHYGFRLVGAHQFIPQRYVLLFRKDDRPVPPSPPFAVQPSPDPDLIQPTSKRSLAYIPNDILPSVTKGGRTAARLLYTALDKNDVAAAREAEQQFTDLIPRERFGDDYTALQWFCEYFSSSWFHRQQMLGPDFNQDYFEFLSANHYDILKKYIRNWYHLSDEELAASHTSGFIAIKKRYLPSRDALKEPATPGTNEMALPLRSAGPGGDQKNQKPDVTQDEMIFWRDFILFNNPYREKWEKTSQIIKTLGIAPGARVADVGCGPGYYSFKFAQLVGNTGRVYALDTNIKHLDYVKALCRRHDIKNVQTIEPSFNNTRLEPDSVDLVFLCSLYSVIYTTSMEKVKDGFVESIKKALRPDGRLVIVDNAIVPDGVVPYHGPHLAPELIVAQMRHYGFEVTSMHQFIPQRYVLMFKRSANDGGR